jgi:hypothetical protein
MNLSPASSFLAGPAASAGSASGGQSGAEAVDGALSFEQALSGQTGDESKDEGQPSDPLAQGSMLGAMGCAIAPLPPVLSMLTIVPVEGDLALDASSDVTDVGVSPADVSAVGVPAAGLPTTGVPATGVPATEVPAQGFVLPEAPQSAEVPSSPSAVQAVVAGQEKAPQAPEAVQSQPVAGAAGSHETKGKAKAAASEQNAPADGLQAPADFAAASGQVAAAGAQTSTPEPGVRAKRENSGALRGAGTVGAGREGVMLSATAEPTPLSASQAFSDTGSEEQGGAEFTLGGKSSGFGGGLMGDPAAVRVTGSAPLAASEVRGSDLFRVAQPTLAGAAHAMHAIETELAKYRPNVPPHLEVDVALDNGESMRVRLDLRGGALHSTFRTDSAEMRAALQQAWPEFAERSLQQGIRLGDATFTSGGRGGSQDLGSGPQSDGRSRQSGSENGNPFFPGARKAAGQQSSATNPTPSTRASAPGSTTRWA